MTVTKANAELQTINSVKDMNASFSPPLDCKDELFMTLLLHWWQPVEKQTVTAAMKMKPLSNDENKFCFEMPLCCN